MRGLILMTEFVKQEGLFSAACQSDSCGVKDYSVRVANKTELSEFWTAIEECHPFVFSSQGLAPTEAEDEGVPIDAPFKVFSIEMQGYAPITSPRDDNELQVYIHTILVREVGPKNFEFTALTGTRRKGQTDKFHVVVGTDLSHVVRNFLDRLKREKIGIESVRRRIRIGSGDSKRVATIRRIVHVRPKKEIETSFERGKPIEWTHRWSVRGHWREIPGLGKDRDGNYSVSGFTWVSEYEKGLEGAPLVTKTRLVSGME